MSSNIPKNIGKTLKKYRKSRCLTQEKLAELTELHRTYIGMVERGEKNITIVNLDKLLKHLNVSLSDFFILLEKDYDGVR